jgi:hypothetical protein
MHTPTRAHKRTQVHTRTHTHTHPHTHTHTRACSCARAGCHVAGGHALLWHPHYAPRPHFAAPWRRRRRPWGSRRWPWGSARRAGRRRTWRSRSWTSYERRRRPQAQEEDVIVGGMTPRHISFSRLCNPEAMRKIASCGAIRNMSTAHSSRAAQESG